MSRALAGVTEVVVVAPHDEEPPARASVFHGPEDGRTDLVGLKGRRRGPSPTRLKAIRLRPTALNSGARRCGPRHELLITYLQ